MDRRTEMLLDDVDSGLSTDCPICGSDRIEIHDQHRSTCQSCGERLGDWDDAGVAVRAYPPTWTR